MHPVHTEAVTGVVGRAELLCRYSPHHHLSSYNVSSKCVRSFTAFRKAFSDLFQHFLSVGFAPIWSRSSSEQSKHLLKKKALLDLEKQVGVRSILWVAVLTCFAMLSKEQVNFTPSTSTFLLLASSSSSCLLLPSSSSPPPSSSSSS